MHKEDRHRKILELLSKQGPVSILELANKLNASMMTIRRDLDILEKNGLVRKMHGSAVLVTNENSQPTYLERVSEYRDEKNRIGKAAADLIKAGSIVLFDAGTTPLAIIQYIPADRNFTAITTGLMTAVALCGKTAANVICIGGNVHPSSVSTINYFAIDMLNNFHADIAFISTKSVSLPDGLFETQLPLIEIKKKMVAVSDKVILLADHRKFNSKALCLSIPLQDIDMIISDVMIPESAIEQLKNLKKEFILV